MVKFAGTIELFNSGSPFYDFIRQASDRGVTLQEDYANGTGEIDISQDAIEYKLSIPVFMAMVNAGIECDELPCFIKVDAVEYAGGVPEIVPNRSYENENGEVVIRTWSEWTDGNDTHEEINGYYYIENGSNGFLNGATLKDLHETTGYEVVTVNDYKAAQPETDDA